jgi:hypothetical protein
MKRTLPGIRAAGAALGRVRNFVSAVRADFDRGVRMTATDDHSADTPENAPYWNSGQRTLRDLPKFSRKAMQDDAARAHQRYGMARRAVANTRGFTVGALPPRPKAKDERVQQKLTAFWDHPRNNLEERIPEWSNDLAVYGELCALVAAGTGNGLGSGQSSLTTIGILDPGVIDDVVTDPQDAQRRIAALVKLRDGKLRAHPIIGKDSTLPSPFEHVTVGAEVELEIVDPAGRRMQMVVVGQPCLYTRVNALSTQARGDSDLYPALDALALRDRGVFSFMERLALIAAFVWDLTFPNSKKPKEVQKGTEDAAKQIGRATGGVFGHTENTSLEAKAPTINAADWAQGIKIPKDDILDTVGQPAHWFSGGGAELSLASAGEMGSPAWTNMQERQTTLRRFIIDLGNYALSQFPEKELPPRDEWLWDVTLPTIVGKDAVREASVLNSQLTAIGQLQDLGLKPKAAVREAVKLGNSYGLELSEDDFDTDGAGIRSRLAWPGTTQNAPTPPDPGAAGKVTPDGQTGDEPRADRNGTPGRKAPAGVA